MTTNDRSKTHYKDWGAIPPAVFSNGWPLCADAFEDQMFYLGSRGYRCIAHDRRGHGRSSQTWTGNDMDTYADDLAALVQHLDLEHAEPCQPFDRWRRSRPLSAAPRHDARREGGAGRRDAAAHAPNARQYGRDADRSVGSGARQRARRPFAVQGLSPPFYGWNRPDAQVSEGVRASFWLQDMMAVFPAPYFCIEAFSQTDQTDLKQVDVPT